MLADDEFAVRKVTAKMLRSLGYTVLQAADGAEALMIAASHDGPIDLLISDIEMPGMGGHSLAEQLRATRPEIKVLLMSGYEEDRVQGCAAYLQKPFSRTELAEKVAELVRPSTPLATRTHSA